MYCERKETTDFHWAMCVPSVVQLYFVAFYFYALRTNERKRIYTETTTKTRTTEKMSIVCGNGDGDFPQ